MSINISSKENLFNLIKLAVFTLLVLWSFVAGIERVWFFNSVDTYPHLLVKETLLTFSDHDVIKYRQQCGQPLDIIPLANKQAYIRCGYFWPATSVWLIKNYNVGNQ